MAKFAVGEIAIIVRGGVLFPEYNDGECEIVGVGPFPAGTRATGPCHPSVNYPYSDKAFDYEIRTPDGYHWPALEHRLRKRPQRGIPLEVLRLFEQPITEDATA